VNPVPVLVLTVALEGPPHAFVVALNDGGLCQLGDWVDRHRGEIDQAITEAVDAALAECERLAA
jgi:hypothetical protein